MFNDGKSCVKSIEFNKAKISKIHNQAFKNPNFVWWFNVLRKNTKMETTFAIIPIGVTTTENKKLIFCVIDKFKNVTIFHKKNFLLSFDSYFIKIWRKGL